MIGSTVQPFPDLDSPVIDIQVGINKIIFKKHQLANIFYISVYALQFSEYTIGVQVKRL
jgi:hypothetical protein